MKRWSEDQPAGEASPPLELGELYRLHGADVARWAARLLGPGTDVDDVVQEVFLIVQRQLSSFRGESRVTTWLYEITFRVAQGWRRRRRLRAWLGLDQAEHLDALVSDRANPLQELEVRQATETVYAVLDRLRERDRTILVLFEVERLSGEEIAALEGTSLNNVWSRIHRARARFIQMYSQLEGERRRLQKLRTAP